MPFRLVARAARVIAPLAAALALWPGVAQAQRASDYWITTWATALAEFPAGTTLPFSRTDPVTIRQVVHTGMGGSSARVVFSNRYGTEPLVVGAAAIGIRGRGTRLQPGSARPVTVGSQRTFTVPPGEDAISDEIDLFIPSLADVTIDLFLPEPGGAPTPSWHPSAGQTSYIGKGNRAGAASFKPMATMTAWAYLTRLDVAGNPGSATVVALGASMTDGRGSTPDENRRWTDRLARRLTDWNSRLGIANLGLSGNQLLHHDPRFGEPMAVRFERDGLRLPNGQFALIQPGSNDFRTATGHPLPSVDRLIAAQRTLIERARAAGMAVLGVTVPPFEGAEAAAPEAEQTRQAVNQWMREQAGYDHLLDADALLRDPERPTRLRPDLDSGDHLHPNDTGHSLLGEAIPLEWFGPPSNRR